MIQVENTPNPESLKFLSEQIISETGTEEFQKSDIENISNAFIIPEGEKLAKRLFYLTLMN